MTPNPTPLQLKTRYPEFTGVADTTVAALISEASPMVDEGWEEGDRLPGVLALTAHYLSLEGYPGRTSPTSAFDVNNSGRNVVSRKVGDVAVQFRDAQGEGNSGTASLGTTAYGRRFLQLLRLNSPAIGLA